MRPDKAREITRKSRKIHGWFSDRAAMLFAWLDEIQQMNHITGDIFEIGCHHGKSTTLLGALVQPHGEKLGVCDLFGDQDANISGSGQGDLEKFRRNMILAGDGLKISIHQMNSMDLSVDEIGRDYRFFHIDGGHDCEETLSDLRLAADSTIKKGIIVLDDPFRSEWPGVTEALIRFLDEYGQFSAIAVGFNKLILVRREYSDLYVPEIQRAENHKAYKLDYPWHIKELPFNGDPLQIFFIPSFLTKKNLAYFARKYVQKRS